MKEFIFYYMSTQCTVEMSRGDEVWRRKEKVKEVGKVEQKGRAIIRRREQKRREVQNRNKQNSIEGEKT